MNRTPTICVIPQQSPDLIRKIFVYNLKYMTLSNYAGVTCEKNGRVFNNYKRIFAKRKYCNSKLSLNLFLLLNNINSIKEVEVKSAMFTLKCTQGYLQNITFNKLERGCNSYSTVYVFFAYVIM